MVTGGEDGKINSWPIHPVEPEAEELIDGDEWMDVDMPSPKGRNRERDGDNELVGFFFYCLILIDIIFIARQTSQTLTCHEVSYRVLHLESNYHLPHDDDLIRDAVLHGGPMLRR